MTITLNGTSGIVNDATDLNYTGTLTGGTGVVNIGSGQVYKDASGNVGIGTSSPAAKLDVAGQGKLNAITFAFNTSYYNTDNSISNYSAGNYMYISGNSTGGTGGLYLQGAGNQKQAIIVDGISTGGNIAFQTNGAERARIDSSGNLLVGKTAANNSSTGVYIAGGGNADHGMINVARPPNTTMIQIVNSSGNTVVGQISQNGTNTTYSTSSDYRLKHDIAPMTGALAKVAQLKPVTYKWNADDSESQGFIAHELQEVVPECVTGEKDAVDADGNPQHQGIDTSFLVATLTAAIQELKAIVDGQAVLIAAQGAEIAALKGAAA